MSEFHSPSQRVFLTKWLCRILILSGMLTSAVRGQIWTGDGGDNVITNNANWDSPFTSGGPGVGFAAHTTIVAGDALLEGWGDFRTSGAFNFRVVDATLTMTGGNLEPGGVLQLNSATNSTPPPAGTAVVNRSGGTLTAAGLAMSQNTGFSSEFNQSGGTTSFNGDVIAQPTSGATAQITVSGGTVSVVGGMQASAGSGSTFTTTVDDGQFVTTEAYLWDRTMEGSNVLIVNGGLAKFGGGISETAGSGSSTLSINLNGGTLAVAAPMVEATSFTVNNASTLVAMVPVPPSFSLQRMTLNATLTVEHERQDGLIATTGPLVGAGSVTLTRGILQFDGLYEATGEITIGSGSEVRFGSASRIISSAAVAANGLLTVNHNQEVGALTGSGTVQLTAPLSANQGGAISTFSGDLMGAAALLVSSDGSNLTLSGDNSGHTGGSEVSGGATLTLGSSNALGGGVNFIRSDGVLDLNGFDSTSDIVLNSTGARLTNTGVGASALSGTLTVFDHQMVAIDGSQDILLTGELTSTGSAAVFEKRGSNTLTLNGNASGYQGAISVTEGTLVVGSQLGGREVNVGIAGALTGDGTIAGDVVVAGELAPGTAIGALIFQEGLTFEPTATLSLQISGAGFGEFDLLDGGGSGDLTLGGVLVLDNTGYTAVLGDTVAVFADWESISGAFSSASGTSLDNGLFWDTSQLATNGTLSVVPEPSVITTVSLALALGAGCVAALRRQRSLSRGG